MIIGRVRYWFVGLALLAVMAGCRRPVRRPDIPPKEVSGAVSARAVTLPTVTQSLSEVRAEMAGLAKFTPAFDGCVLKMAILQDARRKENGVEGYSELEPLTATCNAPAVAGRPGSRRVAWRALTCFNPACRAVGRGGGPFLFTIEYSWVTVDRDGAVRIGEPNIEELNRRHVCPACGSGEYICPYELPQTIVRERQLREQLKKANDAIAEAILKKKSTPTGIRMPKEIMAEIESLPRLYLVSQSGKTKRFEGVIAPTRTTPDGTP